MPNSIPPPVQRSAVFLITALIVFPSICYSGEEVEKKPAPAWVTSVEPWTPKEVGRGDGSVRHLLSDVQEHLEEKTEYNSFVIEILTAAGAEEYSQISVNFQPTYQTLEWHTLEVERDGVKQDRLKDAKFDVIRQEKGMDRQLYDGELTAHVILKDIRPKDRVSYSFSIRGENPIFAGHTHYFSQLAYNVRVGRVNRSAIWNEGTRKLRWQVDGGKIPIQEKKNRRRPANDFLPKNKSPKIGNRGQYSSMVL